MRLTASKLPQRVGLEPEPGLVRVRVLEQVLELVRVQALELVPEQHS